KIHTETLYKATGCPKCRKIGYWGRMAIFEVFPIDEDVRSLVTQSVNLSKLKELQKQKKYETLLQNGIKKVERGLTSLSEVLSVAYE
ncbi:MAG: type II secretion system protein GspE, partial [Candidatus Omnitrophota bacterium]